MCDFFSRVCFLTCVFSCVCLLVCVSSHMCVFSRVSSHMCVFSCVSSHCVTSYVCLLTCLHLWSLKWKFERGTNLFCNNIICLFFSEGIVGPPLTNCHIKLADIPEMDYFAKDNKGEVCCYTVSAEITQLSNSHHLLYVRYMYCFVWYLLSRSTLVTTVFTSF